MSISRFQEKFLGGGCAKFLIMFMALTFIGGLAYMGVNRQDDPNSRPIEAVVTVGTSAITGTALEDAMQRATSSQGFDGMPAPALPPAQRASAAAGAVVGMVRDAATAYLARQAGAKLDEAEVKSLIVAEMNSQIASAKAQMVSAGELKEGATEKEVDAAFKKKFQRTPSEILAQQSAQIDQMLADPKTRESVVGGAAQSFLMARYKQEVPATDDALKADYTTFDFKRILLKDEPTKTIAIQSQEAIADIRAGKLTFEQAIDRYSKDTPMPGKRLSETSLPIPGSVLNSDPRYAAIRTLKAGEVSGLVTVPEGGAIYKLVSTKVDLPKDFEKNKASLKDAMVNRQAAQKAQAEIDKVLKGGLVKWVAPGYQALYDYGQTLGDMDLMIAPDKRTARLKEIVAQAQKAIDAAGPDSRAAALAKFAAFDNLYQMAPDKAAMREERISTIEALLENMEDSQLRLDLVDLYIEGKKPVEASMQLVQAAQGNNSYDSAGQQVYANVASRIVKLRALTGVPAEDLKTLDEEQARWRRDKVQYEKDQAAIKAEQAAAQKEVEAEAKKQREAAAAAEKAAKSTEAGKTGGTQAPK